MIQTERSDVFLDPRGFLVLHARDDSSVSLENVKEDMAALKQLAGDTRFPLMLDIRNTGVVAREGRSYGTSAVREFSDRVAIMVGNSPSRILGNVLLTFNLPDGVQARLFESEEGAIAWMFSDQPGIQSHS